MKASELRATYPPYFIAKNRIDLTPETDVDAILAKRTEGANKIWTAATCDIKGVNTDITKAQRKFCIYVKVKVTPFAQTVELSLENVAQTTVL